MPLNVHLHAKVVWPITDQNHKFACGKQFWHYFNITA